MVWSSPVVIYSVEVSRDPKTGILKAVVPAPVVSFKQETERNPVYFRPPVRSVRAGSVEEVSDGGGIGGPRRCRRIRGGDHGLQRRSPGSHREAFRRRQRRRLQYSSGAAAAAGVLRKAATHRFTSGRDSFVQRRQAAPGGGGSRRIQVEAALSSGGRQLQAATTGAGSGGSSGKTNRACRSATSIPPGGISSSAFWDLCFFLCCSTEFVWSLVVSV
ncbi:hypothetical protein KSP39_PZI022234 [Platanthera zijinensis]|uniref:Uncharacterized protein n=1 Tax=Platanthera zijinensis TaxID=2320716 RepID=A0AAP0FV00_9ASPA